MIAMLEFDLPGETNEHLTAVHAMGYRVALGNMDRQLRDWIKHGHNLTFKTAEEALQAARDFLNDEMAGLEI